MFDTCENCYRYFLYTIFVKQSFKNVSQMKEAIMAELAYLLHEKHILESRLERMVYMVVLKYVILVAKNAFMFIEEKVVSK